MSPSLQSLTSAWRGATTFESSLVHLLVVLVAAAVGAVVSWQVSQLWTRWFGYSSALTIGVTIVVFFTLYVGLGVVAAAVRRRTERRD
ncbi:hypothetical protein [Halobaculum sp. D14]|uniref:hypothetical protein n=1 Tax=Halobaculum sp. D14 TaxID=3421642 RepID=UPI003EBF04D0